MSSRQIVYAGQVPLDSDLLNAQKMIQATVGQLIQAVLGTATLADGFTCIPTSPATMNVQVTAGNLLQLVTVDSSAYGSLGTDSGQIMKIAALATTATLTGIAAPGTGGFSQNYLIQAAFSEADTGSTVLSYYNSANPAVNLSGPNNSGSAQNTQRVCSVTLAVKAGTAASTGTQTTPSADAGYTPLFVVTVANGASSVTAGNIAVHGSAPFIANKLSGGYAVDSGSANTVVASLRPAPLALYTGLRAQINIAATNSGASTLNLNSLGSKSIVKKGATSTTALASADLVAGCIADLMYDGTSWQLLSR